MSHTNEKSLNVLHQLRIKILPNRLNTLSEVKFDTVWTCMYVDMVAWLSARVVEWIFFFKKLTGETFN